MANLAARLEFRAKLFALAEKHDAECEKHGHECPFSSAIVEKYLAHELLDLQLATEMESVGRQIEAAVKGEDDHEIRV